jgi:hypothetical protein
MKFQEIGKEGKSEGIVKQSVRCTMKKVVLWGVEEEVFADSVVGSEGVGDFRRRLGSCRLSGNQCRGR